MTISITDIEKKIYHEFHAIEELETHPEKGVEKINRAMAFEQMIKEYHSPDYDRLFYEMFRNRCKCSILRFILRKEFIKRPNAEIFLLGRSKDENDSDMQAEILQLLGHMKSSHALAMARDFFKHEQSNHREVASFVLGWVGGKDDIPLLQKHMLNEENPHLRITAASAHRQIGWRLPELKKELLASLKEGFEKEKDDEVIAWIIVMIESIAVKRLGLREDKEEPDILHGDVQKAKVKTAKFLAELNL